MFVTHDHFVFILFYFVHEKTYWDLPDGLVQITVEHPVNMYIITRKPIVESDIWSNLFKNNIV